MLALEQIFNNAAKIHYATNGRFKVPMVVRLVIGRGWGQGAQHSQSLESVFGHFPGLKVVMPALAADAKGMLSAAIEDDNAVVSIEHRWLHYVEGAVPDGYHVEVLDGPRRLRAMTPPSCPPTSARTSRMCWSGFSARSLKNSNTART